MGCTRYSKIGDSQASTYEAFVTEAVRKKLINGELSRDNYIKDICLTLSDPTDLKGLPAIIGDMAI